MKKSILWFWAVWLWFFSGSMVFSAGFKTRKSEKPLFFQGRYAQFQDEKRRLIFMDSGLCVGIHRGASAAAVGRFEREKNRIRVFFTGNTGETEEEIFYLKGSDRLMYRGSLLKKVK